MLATLGIAVAARRQDAIDLAWLVPAAFLASAKVGDALAVLWRAARNGGDPGFDTPIFGWASRHPEVRRAIDFLFRTPTVVVLCATATFVGHGLTSVRLGLALETTIIALNSVASLIAAMLFKRYGNGDVYAATGLFVSRTEEDSSGAPVRLDPLAVVLAITADLVIAFASLYHALYGSHPASFSTAQPLGVVHSLYFSLVTAATVGYGDVEPRSSAAQVAVMVQITATATGLALVAAHLFGTRTAALGTLPRQAPARGSHSQASRAKPDQLPEHADGLQEDNDQLHGA